MNGGGDSVTEAVGGDNDSGQRQWNCDGEQ